MERSHRATSSELLDRRVAHAAELGAFSSDPASPRHRHSPSPRHADSGVKCPGRVARCPGQVATPAAAADRTHGGPMGEVNKVVARFSTEAHLKKGTTEDFSACALVPPAASGNHVARDPVRTQGRLLRGDLGSDPRARTSPASRPRRRRPGQAHRSAVPRRRSSAATIFSRPKRTGFFIAPADELGNNIRVYVLKRAPPPDRSGAPADALAQMAQARAARPFAPPGTSRPSRSGAVGVVEHAFQRAITTLARQLPIRFTLVRHVHELVHAEDHRDADPGPTARAERVHGREQDRRATRAQRRRPSTSP